MGNNIKEPTEQEKTNNKVLRQNFRILKNLSVKKAQRHVKEQNEPAFDDIVKDMSDDYGKTVVMESCEEIMKILK